ncbi:MAG: von Willebrand factor type A domain-containing protein [Planctomycetota bacterium]
MNDPIDWSEDPRLVAYALGELDDADRAAIERALAADPDCRAALDEITAFLPELERAVRAGEPEAGLESGAHASIVAAARRGPARSRAVWAQPVALAAAATLAVAFVGFRALLVERGAPVEVAVATLDERAKSDRVAKERVRGRRFGDGEIGVAGGLEAVEPVEGFVASADAPAGSVTPPAPEADSALDVLGEELADGAPADAPAQTRSTESGPSSPAPNAAVAPRLGMPRASKRVAPDEGRAREQARSPRAERKSDTSRAPVTVGRVYPGKAAESEEEPIVEDREILGRNETDANEDFESGAVREIEDLLALRQAASEEVAAVENEFVLAADDPLSTFSIDVDTASYSNARRALQGGSLPRPGEVRIEEFVNYFSYDDAAPGADDAHPFRVHVETGAAPWAPAHRLVRIGLKGRPVGFEERSPANLVFLVDVSGSMNRPERLPGVTASLAWPPGAGAPHDRVAIVVYASAEGLALPSTPVSAREAILQSLERLDAGGSTNGGAGIELAYAVAREHFVEGGINRVVLCTDGNFNVGVTRDAALEELIAEKARSGIDLTVLGFGAENFQDGKMEALSNRGNGNFAYIDTEAEARKVLVSEVGGTLETIAKDVKIQVVWNPARVQAFRLLGYENRMLEHRDFEDDRKDAGEIGAGHGVTALYEVVPWGLGFDATRATGAKPDPAALERAGGAPSNGPFVTVRLRYKPPGEDESVGFEVSAIDSGASFDGAPESLRFASSVAGFAMLLRGSRYVGEATFEDVRRWALEAQGDDPGGLRAAFVGLVERAIDLRR